MAKPDFTEKEARRIEKEREHRARDKKKLFKKMVKEIQGANRRRVKEALGREKGKEKARRTRIDRYQKWLKGQHEVRHRDYQQRQEQLARQERVRMGLLKGKRKRLWETAGSGGDFAISLGFVSGLFGFFAVMVVCFFFGANLSAVLFFGLLALLLFGAGGVFLARAVETHSPGFHLGQGSEAALPARGSMVDAVIGGENGYAAGAEVPGGLPGAALAQEETPGEPGVGEEVEEHSRPRSAPES